MMMRAAATLCLVLLAWPGLAQDAARWEKTIQNFEEQDAASPPESGGILFVGSSSIRFWNTDEDFPEHDIVNRGFGGSQTSDLLAYMDRIVLPYKPRLIVLYVGDNDIAADKNPEQVVADTTEFVNRAHTALPDTKIVYIAIKPSLARWHLVEPMRTVNREIEKMAGADPKLAFVDVDTPMIGDDGTPREELFISDGLHLSEAGYALWNNLVRPHLDTPGD